MLIIICKNTFFISIKQTLSLFYCYFYTKVFNFVNMKNNITIKIGNRIRDIRQHKKLKQENVAHDLHISLTAYSKIERGLTQMSVVRLKQIADYFETPLIHFFDPPTLQKLQDYKENNLQDNADEKNLKLQLQQLHQQIIQLNKIIDDKNLIIQLLNEKIAGTQFN